MIPPLLIAMLGLAALALTVRADVAQAKVRTYPYQSCFEVASRLHDVPLDVLLAVAATESAWNPDARSHANAHGIMQIQWPGTARHLGVTRLSELYNPCLNIELGARYLRELLDANEGDLSRALAAYNYGPTRIRGLSELPSGAVGYVDRVGAHRARIRSGSQAASQRIAGAEGAMLRFDHGARARRFAETLNARIASADFSWQAVADGYAVMMTVKPDGLSLQDVALLESLGWPRLAGVEP